MFFRDDTEVPVLIKQKAITKNVPPSLRKENGNNSTLNSFAPKPVMLGTSFESPLAPCPLVIMSFGTEPSNPCGFCT